LRLKAVENNKSIRFINGDVTEKTSVNEKFDTITMMGVLCIFDNYEQIIHNVISWLKPKGRLILFNMISEKSLQLVCEKNLAELRTVNPFTIELDIKQKSDDLMRSWTEKDGNNIRQIYNATHIRQPFKLAIIEKKQ
jgi:2-polyprenyl-3-methyl-5-hydroxy-6-metoxy-1,4-benzoquinol methylase